MDEQRPYSTEPPPWHNDRDDSGRPPGQRDPRYGERYPDDARYSDDPRYRDAYVGGYSDESTGGFGSEDDQRYESGVPDQRYDSTDSTRGGRSRGPRSNLEMPEGGPDAARDDQPARYRTEMLDRGQLRRPAGDAMTSGGGGPVPGPLAGPGSPAGLGSPAGPGSPAGVPPLAPTSTVYQAGATPTQAMPTAPANSAPNEAYRARRSGVAGLLGVIAVVVELVLLVKVLVGSITSHPTNVGGVLAGILAMCGVPMIAIGLYGLATGAAMAGGPNVGRAWLRTPLAYLPVGLVLVIAAGMAA